MANKSTFRIISETCQTVGNRVSQIDFGSYLDLMQHNDPETILRSLAQAAADIAQEYGASAVRSALGDEIEDLRNTIGDLKDRVKTLEIENDDLAHQVKGYEKELAAQE